jgi:hypothetical protein
MTLKKRKSPKKVDDVDPKILRKIKEPKDSFLEDIEEVSLDDALKEEEAGESVDEDKDN